MPLAAGVPRLSETSLVQWLEHARGAGSPWAYIPGWRWRRRLSAPAGIAAISSRAQASGNRASSTARSLVWRTPRPAPAYQLVILVVGKHGRT